LALRTVALSMSLCFTDGLYGRVELSKGFRYRIKDVPGSICFVIKRITLSAENYYRRNGILTSILRGILLKRKLKVIKNIDCDAFTDDFDKYRVSPATTYYKNFQPIFFGKNSEN